MTGSATSSSSCSAPRILPRHATSRCGPTATIGWLHGERFASSRVRYARLGDDVEADIGTMPAPSRRSARCSSVDRQRGVAANGLPELEDKMRADAAARQAENEAHDRLVRPRRRAIATTPTAMRSTICWSRRRTRRRSRSTACSSDLAIYVEAARARRFLRRRAAGPWRPQAAASRARATRIRQRRRKGSLSSSGLDVAAVELAQLRLVALAHRRLRRREPHDDEDVVALRLDDQQAASTSIFCSASSRVCAGVEDAEVERLADAVAVGGL